MAKHIMSAIPGYYSWSKLKSRCLNPKDKKYEYYGGKGVTVCDRWIDSFENFLEDMGERPSASHSIDRYPNKNGNYEPGNCRWATDKEQNRNRNYCRMITYNGMTKSMIEWSEFLGIEYRLIAARIITGRWSIERAFSTPKNIRKTKIITTCQK